MYLFQLEKRVVSIKTIIVKPNFQLQEIQSLAEKRKTNLFGTALTRPKPNEINVASVDLFFEPIWKVAGKYEIDYYRKNIHHISVDASVKEILIGPATFPVMIKIGMWKKLKKSVKIGRKKNNLDLPVEEHLEIDKAEEIYLNSSGQKITLRHKIAVKNIENFTDSFIQSNKNKMRHSDTDSSDVVSIFLDIIKKDIGEYTKIVREILQVNILEQIFFPVYEVRCAGPKNTVKIMRIDGMNSKIM